MGFGANDISVMRQSGTGNMGSVSDTASLARFVHSAPSYFVHHIFVDFTAGTGSATLTAKVDSGAGTLFDRVLWEFAAVGNAVKNVRFSLRPDEYKKYILGSDNVNRIKDVLVLEWTDPGTSTWNINVGLVDASLIDA